jgi:dihydroorotate dehydrogenase (NAD+) catalytic subunit
LTAGGATDFCGLRLAHPIVNGSGTFDAIAARRAFGDAVLEHFPFSAFVSKTITLAPRDGNPPPRLYETPAGLINSIGLPNKGLRGYLAHDLPELARLPVPLITNVMGSTAGELCALVEALDARDEVDALELNVSCPNVSTGLDIGADPAELAAVLGEVRPRTAKPLIVKLTPNTADVAAVAQAAQDTGADAVSLINTLRAYAPHPRRAGAAWLGNATGGLSGPAVRAVALAQVRAVAARVSIPVVGMGGVQSGLHAAHMLDAGATLVGVGTESFRDPAAGTRISRELDDLFAKSGDNLG